jgi:hypothetical protein
VAASVLKGLESSLELSGADIGASEVLIEEKIVNDITDEPEDSKNVSEEVLADKKIVNDSTDKPEDGKSLSDNN